MHFIFIIDMNISIFSIFINPLPPEFFLPSFFGTYPKIGSIRLPTRSRDAHRKFFDDPFLN